MSDFESVYTVTDWYDGARAGVADYGGLPHYYENRWDDDLGAWDEFYFLTPLDDETFALTTEDWEIWLRWEHAFKAGETSQETRPALPADRQRLEELKGILSKRLVVNQESIKAKAVFIYGQPPKVRWTILKD